jgi:beta-lactamase regulating signal transducer with metallopeptidase domain
MNTALTTTLTAWLSPHAMQSLGWTLLHFLWQGTALAALAAASTAMCRRASVRYVVLFTVLGLMLCAPVATFFFYQNQHASLSAGPWSRIASQVPTIAAASSVGVIPRSLATHVSLDPLPWLVEAWLIGVAFFSLRFAGGFFLLERKRRNRSSAVEPRVLQICRELQDRLGIRRAIRYCECAWLQAPAVVGWFRPIVFLPVTALTGLSEEQLRSVIAHELAHIRRFDAFVNVFQICVETLFFYHPAVWWLNKRIRAEREHCCDDMAVAICGNAVEYARALTLMEEWRTAPGFAMAANRGPLTERIVHVLGLKALSQGMRSIGWAGSILALTAALFAGHTLLRIARPPIARAAVLWQSTPKPQASSAQASSPSAASTSKPSAVQASGASASASASASSYIDGMKAAGLPDLTVDQLIALKVQDVTPEYVREVREQGLNPTADNLIAMRVQGITPDYVHEWHAVGLNPDINHLISLRVQGADAAYYSELKQAGIDADVDRLISMKVQGVTPEYVRELHTAGLNLTADQVISFKVQGVTPAYLKAMHEQGIDPSANEAISMRVQDVTPEYVRDIHALGLKPSTNELISMRVQDVTPEYIKALQSAGFKLNVSQIISAKVQDLTPEFIERARKHGFQNLDLNKLIQLRQLGILDSKAEL